MRDTPIPHDLFVTIQSVLCERLQGWASFIFAASRLAGQLLVGYAAPTAGTVIANIIIMFNVSVISTKYCNALMNVGSSPR